MPVPTTKGTTFKVQVVLGIAYPGSPLRRQPGAERSNLCEVGGGLANGLSQRPRVVVRAVPARSPWPPRRSHATEFTSHRSRPITHHPSPATRRAHQPPGRTIPEGNAYPSPGLPSGAPATPGQLPKSESFLKGMHMGDLASTRLVITIPVVARTTPHGPGPMQSAPPRKHPAPGICNPYRIESCVGPVTRGTHVAWQRRARICKSFRLVPAPTLF